VAPLIDSASTVDVLHDLPVRAGRHSRLGFPAVVRWRLGCLAVDSAMLGLAVTATSLGSAAAGIETVSVGWALGYGLLALILLAMRGLYAQTVRLRTMDDLRQIAAAAGIAALAMLALAALLDRPDTVDATLRLWLFTTAYVGAGRVSMYWSQKQARLAGDGLRPTLIIGAGRVGRLTAQRLLSKPELGLKPIGFLDKNPMSDDGHGALLPVIGASWDLDEVVREYEVEQVIITFSTAPNDVLVRLVRRCEELGVAVAVVPRFYEQTTTRLTVDHMGGLPLVSAHTSDPRGLQFAVKYALDRIVALALVVLLAPIFLGAAVATYLSLGRPIFFRQRRVGRDGVEFEMLKFRTMCGSPADRGERDAAWAKQHFDVDAVADEEAEGADEDPRTRVGTFLRRTSIDELPQLLNVLMGHMSLVGPRPERAHYVHQFEQHVYRYGDRHRVKSGITGWAQVHGLRGQTSLSDRVEWDNHYIENFSLWLDVKILVLTFAAVFAWFTSGE
jgi:exopolysaccharide biosynthesis polyprenyl glycosylphosphotransferase